MIYHCYVSFAGGYTTICRSLDRLSIGVYLMVHPCLRGCIQLYLASPLLVGLGQAALGKAGAAGISCVKHGNWELFQTSLPEWHWQTLWLQNRFLHLPRPRPRHSVCTHKIAVLPHMCSLVSSFGWSLEGLGPGTCHDVTMIGEDPGTVFVHIPSALGE